MFEIQYSQSHHHNCIPNPYKEGGRVPPPDLKSLGIQIARWVNDLAGFLLLTSYGFP
jgi:hypothetical protein